jgi:hypothetical protein
MGLKKHISMQVASRPGKRQTVPRAKGHPNITCDSRPVIRNSESPPVGPDFRGFEVRINLCGPLSVRLRPSLPFQLGALFALLSATFTLKRQSLLRRQGLPVSCPRLSPGEVGSSASHDERANRNNESRDFHGTQT